MELEFPKPSKTSLSPAPTRLSPAHAPSPVAEFYLRERRKLTLWAHLFQRLNEVCAQGLSLAELEARPEYTCGLRDALATQLETLSRLEAKQRRQALAWAIAPPAVSILEAESFITAEEAVDLRLLESLVVEAGLELPEAAVLLVRERATLPPGAPAAKLLGARLRRQLRGRGQWDAELASRVAERLRRAEEKRKELFAKRGEGAERALERISEIRSRRDKRENELSARIEEKAQRIQSRRCDQLLTLRERARQSSVKASEISVLQELETDARRRETHARLAETSARRALIVTRLRERLREEEAAQESARQRRAVSESERRESAQRKLARREEARARRAQLLSRRSSASRRPRTDESFSSQTSCTSHSYAVSALLADKDTLDRRFRALPPRLRRHRGSRSAESTRFSPARAARESAYAFLTRDLEMEEWLASLRRPPQTQPLIPELPELLIRGERLLEAGPTMALCTLCDLVFAPADAEKHLASRPHHQARLALPGNDEPQCVVMCAPAQMPDKRLAALRRRGRKLRSLMALKALQHDPSASLRPAAEGSQRELGARDVASAGNRSRLQKLCLDLDRLINCQARDFAAVRACLQEIAKILDKNVESDLHALRHFRFLLAFTELCRLVGHAPRFELQALIETLREGFGVFVKLCLVRENRVYLLITNRAAHLLDALVWAFGSPLRALLSLQFLPQALHVLALVFRTRPNPQHAAFLQSLAEVFFFCGLPLRIREKFEGLAGAREGPSSEGQAGVVIVKTLQLLEAVLVALAPGPAHAGVSESIAFVCGRTDLCGCVQLLAALLLLRGQFSRSHAPLSPVVQAVAGLVLKVLCAFARYSLPAFQALFAEAPNGDQLYHVLLYLLDYGVAFGAAAGAEAGLLLNDALVLMGYFARDNPGAQEQLCRGTESQSLVCKAANMPYAFFFGEPALRELLFPTLVCLTFGNAHTTRILFGEMNSQLLLQFLRAKKVLYAAKEDPSCHEVEASYGTERSQSGLRMQPEYLFHQRCDIRRIDAAIAFYEGFDRAVGDEFAMDAVDLPAYQQ